MRKRSSNSAKLVHCEQLEERRMLSVSSWDPGLGEIQSVPLVSSSSATPAFEFFRLQPLGGLASTSQDNVGTISSPSTDQLDFTFGVDAGEQIAAVAIPSNPGAVLTVSYVEGAGASETAALPGQSVTLAPRLVGSAGNATVRITSSVATEVTLDIYRNTALESAVGESTSSNPLDLASGQVDVGWERFAALGDTSLQPTQSTLFAEDFSGVQSFQVDSLWHQSDGRSLDGQANHSGEGLYFGLGEDSDDFVGTLGWDAAADNVDDNIWPSVVNNSTTPGQTTQWAFPSNSTSGTNGPPSNLPGVSEWYTFGPPATMWSIESSRGDAATELDVSWELVFRPRDFTGNHVLFETGSNGDGTAILLLDETLEFRVQDSSDPTRRVVRNFTFDAANDVDKFHHVVISVQPSSTAGLNSVRMFVNGVEVGSAVSAPGVLGDWSNTGNAGLGASNGDFPDSSNTTVTGNFDGDIASLRYFEDRLFSAGDVRASYNNLLNDLPVRIGNYDNDQAVAGDAVSPSISLTGGSEYTLSFNMLSEVEDVDAPFELMQVLVMTAGFNETVLLDRFDETLPFDTNGQWANIEADLTPFAGQTIEVVFRFDSVDDNNNQFEGWWIDDFEVTRSNGTPSLDDDEYSIDLTPYVGQQIDIVLAGQGDGDYANETLELQNAGGSILATGVSDPSGTDASNYDLGILGYEVLAGGIHTIRVASSTTVVDEEYGLLVTPRLAFETEGLAGDPLRRLGAFAAGGYLRAAGIESYGSRSAFDADNPSLSFEDFEDGVVNSDGLATFPGPLDSTTSSTAFPTGIAPGLSISTQFGGDLALLGPDFVSSGNPGSQAVGADVFTDNTTLTFDAGVFAVGFDIIDSGDVIVLVFDDNNLPIFSDLIQPDPAGAFFGVASTNPISRIELSEVLDLDGELIDNVSFGAAGVVPEFGSDSFVVNLDAGQTVQLATSTPFDDPSISPLNDLDPRLEITGPGISSPITDLNSGADGKNATVTFTAPASGEFTISVAPQAGQGEYLVYFGGDYNRNGAMDAADFTVWRDSLGSAVPSVAGADGDGSGVIDQADYDVWATNFGLTLTSSVVFASDTPAPTTIDTSYAPSERSVAAELTDQVVEEEFGIEVAPKVVEIAAPLSRTNRRHDKMTSFQALSDADRSDDERELTTRDRVFAKLAMEFNLR